VGTSRLTSPRVRGAGAPCRYKSRWSPIGRWSPRPSRRKRSGKRSKLPRPCRELRGPRRRATVSPCGRDGPFGLRGSGSLWRPRSLSQPAGGLRGGQPCASRRNRRRHRRPARRHFKPVRKLRRARVQRLPGSIPMRGKQMSSPYDRSQTILRRGGLGARPNRRPRRFPLIHGQRSRRPADRRLNAWLLPRLTLWMRRGRLLRNRRQASVRASSRHTVRRPLRQTPSEHGRRWGKAQGLRRISQPTRL
jgi:hypothetical protein